MIRAWGKLLYIDYLSLPTGRDYSQSEELENLAEEFLYATHNNDEDKLEELDEWISEGCPMKDGRKLLNRTTIDNILTGAQRKAGKVLKLYRYHHGEMKLKPHSWISMTDGTGFKYDGDEHVFEIQPDDLVIDTKGLADKGEYIVRTDLLISRS